MREFSKFNAVDLTFWREALDCRRVGPLLDDVLVSEHLARAYVFKHNYMFFHTLGQFTVVDSVAPRSFVGGTVELELEDPDIFLGLLLKVSDVLNAFFNLATNFEYTFFNNVDEIGVLALRVDGLIPEESLLVE